VVGELGAEHERESVLHYAGADAVAGRYWRSLFSGGVAYQRRLMVHCLVLVSGKHTVFGRISSGMKVIQRMGMVPTGPNDR
jgi:cyclophilin family peptidyl-prolyl cis-trans isomerase